MKKNFLKIAALLLVMLQIPCFSAHADACEHTLTHCDEVLPTDYTESGHIEYWHCDNCDKYFSNADATDEVANVATSRIAEGNIQFDVNYYVVSSGKLVITGSGETADYQTTDISPWTANGYGDNITSAQVDKNITRLGNYLFYGCTKLVAVTFSGSAPVIADSAFSGCTLTVKYPAGDSSWDAVKGKNYGGTITWQSYGETPVSENSISYAAGEVTLTAQSGTTIGGTVYVAEYDSDGTMTALKSYPAASVIEDVSVSAASYSIMWLDADFVPLADAFDGTSAAS